MIRYRKILEMHFNGISQRTISTSVGILEIQFPVSSKKLKFWVVLI